MNSRPHLKEGTELFVEFACQFFKKEQDLEPLDECTIMAHDRCYNAFVNYLNDQCDDDLDV